jgi:GH18 family chitinase
MNGLIKKSLALLSVFSLTTLSTISLASTQTTPEPDGSWVGGYYTSWSYWRGGSSLKSLDALKQSVGGANFITYAFLGITTSATIKDNKPTYGGVTIPTSHLGQPGTVVDLEALADNADGGCPGLPSDPKWCAASHVLDYLHKYSSSTSNKTILLASIGGWSYTHRFSEFYQDYENNANVLNVFLDSAVTWLKAHPSFSGLDVDWEYPGYGHDSTAGGVHTGEGILYMRMLSALRARLDTLGQQVGKHYYLTTAVVANAAKAAGEAQQGVNWSAVASNVDWINLMAFDQNAEFNLSTDGLAHSMDDPATLQKSINYYLGVGIPSQKMVLGMPLYGREMLVSGQPIAPTFGYGGDLRYANYQNFFNLFSQAYYKNNPAYFNYQDNPNPEPYYPVGGMVDFTGSYDYSCFVAAISGGKASDSCFVSTAKDNRGNQGQALPVDLKVAYPDAGVSWIYGTSQSSVNALFTGAPSQQYPGYPVFTIDTPSTVDYKVRNLVQKDKLGGVWFWELSEDSLTQPNYSLYAQACKDLGKDGKCLTSSGPAPQPSQGVSAGACSSGDKDCLNLSDNSGHPSDSFTVTCNNAGGKHYNFTDMQGACNDSPSCMKHVSLSTCTNVTVNPTGRDLCSGVPVSAAGVTTCDVNTLTCNCHPAQQ